MAVITVRHSVVVLFFISILALVGVRWYKSWDQQGVRTSNATPLPTPIDGDPLSITCKKDEDCGKGFFCREGECSEYLYDVSCSESSDCRLVNTDYGYGCCWSGTCQPKNYGEDSWIAVNAAAFQSSQTELCPTEDQCGPAPLCPESAGDASWSAECQENVCVKTKIEQPSIE